MKKTILYYTSNREKPKFEKKIRATILKNCGDLPIISVSQKPINFGQNICVGNRGLSYLNEWRQIIIGAKAAKADYLVFTESDFLYPPAYFQFKPQGKKVYRWRNVWIIFHHRQRRFKKKFAINNSEVAYRKRYSEGAQIVKRKFIIKHLEKCLRGCPDWFDGPRPHYMSRNQLAEISRRLAYTKIHHPHPCVSFKTGDGTRTVADVSQAKRDQEIVNNLPYWGKVTQLKKRYLCTK